MGHGEVGLVDRDSVDRDQVHVQRPRPPAHLPDPAGRLLDLLRTRQQVARPLRPFADDDGVQVVVLLRPADRFGLVHR
jgi:hypothetical protein